MADFNVSYLGYVKPHEGGYANVTGDKGGETYAGIARNIWPNEPIWSRLDAKKYDYKNYVLPHNIKFSDLDSMVTDFYRRLWDKNKLSLIYDQNVANLVFDYIVHSGKAVKNIQTVLGFTGKDVDGIIGTMTLNAINGREPVKLRRDILAQREEYLRGLANEASQQQFLKGWLNRLKTFYDELPGQTVLPLAIIAIIILILLTL